MRSDRRWSRWWRRVERHWERCDARPAQLGGLRQPCEVLVNTSKLDDPDTGRQEVEQGAEQGRRAGPWDLGGNDHGDSRLDQKPELCRQLRIERARPDQLDDGWRSHGPSVRVGSRVVKWGRTRMGCPGFREVEILEIRPLSPSDGEGPLGGNEGQARRFREVRYEVIDCRYRDKTRVGNRAAQGQAALPQDACQGDGSTSGFDAKSRQMKVSPLSCALPDRPLITSPSRARTDPFGGTNSARPFIRRAE